MRILVIDNLEVVYYGLKCHLNSKFSEPIVHWAGDLAQAERQIGKNPYDLVISELDFMDVDGLDILEALSKRYKTDFMIYTSLRNAFRIKWLKDCSFINNVCFKEDGFNAFTIETDVQFGRKIKAKTYTSFLSKREEEVLSFVSMGLTNKLIASRLQLSSKTVATYKHRLLKKLGLNSELELFAFQNRISNVSVN